MLMIPLEDAVNPNMGWMIAPLAIATEPLAKAAAIDPSIPEVFYGIAAIIYAIAAYRKTIRESKTTRKSSYASKLISRNDDCVEDTVDIKHP